MVDSLKWAVVKHIYLYFLIKRLELYTPSATDVRISRNAIRGLAHKASSTLATIVAEKGDCSFGVYSRR